MADMSESVFDGCDLADAKLEGAKPKHLPPRAVRTW